MALIQFIANDVGQTALGSGNIVNYTFALANITAGYGGAGGVDCCDVAHWWWWWWRVNDKQYND